MKAVILAAGMGTRLGTLIPKPLTSIIDETTILDFQVEMLSEALGVDNIIVVVGYKKELIMEKCPQLAFVYNSAYAQTGTGKSLLLALRKVDEDVIWLNGDVFFDRQVLDSLFSSEYSCCLVDRKTCGEEEVKYDLKETGFVRNISKSVQNAKGECLGINIIRRRDLNLFREELERIDSKAYFEKALENLTVSDRLDLLPICVEPYYCREIDYEEDLMDVREHTRRSCVTRRENASKDEDA
ncbi:MAG: phosphocholine cytidylyltransferase family protein [Phycisphaerales bacterium]|nr:MAG: phosphocholine cytidylyltransferase family protein [Phycisphaerales bacterium]